MTTNTPTLAQLRALFPHDKPHGVPGQSNVLVLDVDSPITGYGKHNKIHVGRLTGDESDLILVSETDIGLPDSTDADRRKEMQRDRFHPRGTRLVHVSSEEWINPNHGGRCIDHTYRITGKGANR